MPLPVDLALITVTGDYTDILGNDGTGTVLFILDMPLDDLTGKVVITAGVTPVQVVNSRWSLTVPRSDNAVSPSPFPYRIIEQVPGVQRDGLYLLTADLPNPVDITALVPVNPPPPYSTYYGVLTQTNVWTGTTNDFTGSEVTVRDPVNAHDPVSLEYFNAHGGAAVTSVNGHTGAVVLNAGDVAAIPASGPTTDIAWNGHKVTGLANGAGAQDAAAFGQIPTPGSVTAQTSFGQASANGSSTSYSHTDHAHGTPSLLDRHARMCSLAAETFPAENINHLDLGLSSGFLIAGLVRPGLGPITNVGTILGAHGITPSGVNVFVLFDEAGNQLAVTADLSAALSNPANDNTFVEFPLTAPYTNTTETAAFYAGALCHMSGGDPKIGGIFNGSGLQLPMVKGHRLQLALGGQSTVPSSFSPAGAGSAAAAYYFTLS